MLKRSQSGSSRRAHFTVFAVLLFTFLLFVVAFVIDLGYVTCVVSQAQAAADAAALAAARGIPFGPAQVLANAQACAQLNTANGQPVTLQKTDVVMGTWDQSSQTFTPGVAGANAVQVTVQLTAAQGNPVSLFFSQITGNKTAGVTASAIATSNRWDVVFSQDISASYAADLSQAVIGTQDAVTAFNSLAPQSYFGVVQHGGWGSTWASLQPVGPNYAALNTTIGNLKDAVNSTSKIYDVAPYPSINPTTLTPTTCGSDLATGLQQAINMFTDPSYTANAPAGTRRAIIVSSDGKSNVSPSGQHSTSMGYTDASLDALAKATAQKAWNNGSGPDGRGGISVFVLLYFHGSDTSADTAVLQSLVQGEGTFSQVTDPTQVPTALKSIITSNLKHGLVK